MARAKIERYDHIIDDQKRRVTLSKRKKGLLKKSIELSKLCSVKVFMLIYDPKTKRFAQYRSTASFDADECRKITRDELDCKFFTNDDYDDIFKEYRSAMDKLERRLGHHECISDGSCHENDFNSKVD